MTEPEEIIATEKKFDGVFETLRGILKQYDKRLKVTADSSAGYSLMAGYSERWKREIFFGAVEEKKSYISFHLMPIYMFPELLDGISSDLRARMQGKSCFNFKTADPKLLKELEALTRKGFDRFRKEGLA